MKTAEKMYTITKEEYANTHNDFKGVYSSDDIHGTKLNGRKTILKFIEGKGTCLLTEGVSFIIVDSEELNTNPIRVKPRNKSDFKSFKTINHSETTYKSEELKEAVKLMLKTGFDVLVYGKDLRKSYAKFQEGDNLGYIENNRFGGLDLSTVHKGNINCGTGFRITEKPLSSVSLEDLRSTFINAPHWAKKSNVQHVQKYNGFKEYFSIPMNQICEYYRVLNQ